jgi:hypothetical protein
MILPDSIIVTSCRTDEQVRARIVNLHRKSAQDNIDLIWWGELNELIGSRDRDEPDEHWEWGVIADQCGVQGGWCKGAETPDGHIQGAIAYTANSRSLLESGEASLYVAYVATAPWNRGWLVDRPMYRGTGRRLILYASLHSYMLGLKGRLRLSALPSQNTIDFYDSMGFTKLDDNKDRTVNMELSADRAMTWLEQEGILS